MPLPSSIRVKLSSEEAGALTITPVVAQDISFADLLERIVENTGKDVVRIMRILRAGELASGATRYRFAGWDADPSEVVEAITRFPDPDPTRPFLVHDSVKAVFQNALGARLEVPREAGKRRRFLQRRSFWDSLVEILAAENARYLEYSYKDRADCYRIQLSRAAALAIHERAGMIAYRGLAQKIKLSTFDTVDAYVPRAAKAGSL